MASSSSAWMMEIMSTPCGNRRDELPAVVRDDLGDLRHRLLPVSSAHLCSVSFSKRKNVMVLSRVR